MKTKLLLLTGLCSLFLLTGCADMYGCSGCSCSGDCGYYDYNSQCGQPSCTNTTVIVDTSACSTAYGCY